MTKKTSSKTAPVEPTKVDAPIVDATPTEGHIVDCDYCNVTGLLSSEELCPKCKGTGKVLK